MDIIVMTIIVTAGCVQVHRALNLASLLVAVVGVVLVFIAHKNQDPPGLIDLGKINVCCLWPVLHYSVLYYPGHNITLAMIHCTV